MFFIMPLETDEMRNFAEQSLRQENMEYDFPSRAAVSCIWRCTAEICDRLERMEEQVCDRLDKHLQIHIQVLDTALKEQYRQQDQLPPVSESAPAPGRGKKVQPEPQENQQPVDQQAVDESTKSSKTKSTKQTNRRPLTKGKREASL
jgi:predicted RNA-binding protein YlxR (DUF448 family)